MPGLLVSSWPVLAVALCVGVAVCLSFVLGRKPERVAAILYMLACVALQALTAFDVGIMKWGHLGVGLVCLAVFVALCWKAAHPWPLWVTGGQVLSVMTSVVGLSNAGIGVWAYKASLLITVSGVLLGLTVGTWAAWKTRQQIG